MRETPVEAAGGKVLYFEWARVAAAGAVVLLHVMSSIMDNNPIATVGVIRSLAWAEMQMALVRWAVPVFLMITGALLLDPEKEIGWEKVGRYIRRMVIVLCTFGLAFCIVQSYYQFRALSPEMVWSAVLDLLSNNGWSHMWYVYALIGIYLLLPLMKGFIANAERRDIEVLLVVLFALTCVVPTVNSAFGTEIDSLIWVTSSVFYVFMGFYSHRYLVFDGRVLVVGLSALAVGIALTAVGVLRFEEYWAFLAAPSSFIEAAWSVCVFLLMKRFLDRPYADRGVIATLSSLGFGIYIIHPLFINVLYKGLDWGPWTLPPGVFELSVWAISFFGSVLLVFAMKRIPLLKDVL